jgi:hypothetical protein
VKTEAGDIVDAWIIAQNEPASQITGVYDHATSDLLLRRARLFARDDVWDHITKGLGSRATVATLSDQTEGVTLNLYTELIGEYLVLRMTYVAPVNETFLID